MKNIHLSHPEDLVFDGKDAVRDVISVFRSLLNDYNQDENVVSVKYDGAPAIVFGTDPTNKRFFVGTKSVFNKKIKKICYTNACIDYYYSYKDNLAHVLKLCLKYLPRVAGVYQADFIGLGDGNLNEFTPNTITYKFDKAPTEDIIMAVHTCYVGSNFDDMIAVPQSSLTMPGLNVKWVNGTVEYNDERIIEEAFEYTMHLIIDQLEIMSDEDFPEFKTKVAKSRVLKQINSYIRNGEVINSIHLANENAINSSVYDLFNLISEAKEILINRFLPNENVECFINNQLTNHEGIVVTHIPTCRMIKLVDRYNFSRSNFNCSKFAEAN